MKNYLREFLETFQFPDAAKTQLIAVYDELCEKGGEIQLFDFVNRYKQGLLTYDKSLQKIEMLANEKGINYLSLALVYLIFLADVLKTQYKEVGISEDIWRDSVSDLKYKALDCEGLCGIWGTQSVGFHKSFFEMTAFGFGKLQFKITEFNGEYHRNGLELDKKTPVVYVHVPRTGEKLDYASVENSYKRAQVFFKEYFGDVFKDRPFVFVYRSWMLFDRWKEFLSPQSNFMRFCSDYDVFASGEYGDYSTAWRVFYRPYEGDISKMPQDTSLQRACAQLIQREEKLGWGWGVYCPIFS